MLSSKNPENNFSAAFLFTEYAAGYAVILSIIDV